MKPILEFQVNGSFNILKQTIEGMTDEEWTSRPYPSANLVGFTAWHSLRTIDWAINTAIRGVPEMAADPEWRDVKPDGAYFGAGVSKEEADAIARKVSRSLMTGYLEALRAQAMSWLRALPSDDLDQPVDLKSAGGPEADHHQSVVWAEVEDLDGIPTWQFLARPCVSHIRVHYGEMTSQLEAMRASAPA